jgi:glyoxylase-like metal-dependent hydrolase (beta-lactamase superfamily II)
MEPIRLELPTSGMGLGPVNAYLFCEPEPLLVDAGLNTAESWSALEEGLAAHGLAVADLSRLIITHPHIDHFGQAAAIVAASTANVWICELGASWLLQPALMWQRVDYYESYFLPRVGLSSEAAEPILAFMRMEAAGNKPIPPNRLISFPPDGVLQMGGRSWQVLHTPGHASAHTCFYQPESGQLLSGDMLLSLAPTPVVEPPAPGHTERIPALPQFLQSLAMLETIEIETVYPGHGAPFNDHRGLIGRQRARIEQRAAECIDLIHQGLHTIPELLDIMYAHQPQQFRLAGLWMLVGYLDLLAADRLVEQRLVDGVWYYLPTL